MNNKTHHPILVIGGTGKTGRRIIERLRARNLPVRVGSRNQPIPFTWEDPSTWPAVLADVKTAYVAYFPDLACDGALTAMREFADTARRSGVKRIVLLSGRGEPEAVLCEQTIHDFDWTVLRCSWFNQNFNEGYFCEPLIHGALQLPVADIPEPFIDADDIADVAVKVLTEAGHSGQVYELTGPRALTFRQAVAEIAEATGRSLQFAPIPEARYRDMMTGLGVPAIITDLTMYLYQEVLDGRNAQPTDTIQQLLGRAPKDFADFARLAVVAGDWQAPSHAMGGAQ